MKRFIAHLLIATMLCTVCMSFVSNTTTYAETENLLTNGDFEDGIEGWIEGGCTIAEEYDTVHSGDGSLFNSSRKAFYSSAKQNLMPIVQQNGAGEYKFSAWLRLEKGQASIEMRPGFEFTNNGVRTYPGPGMKSITDDSWTYFEFTFDCPDPSLVSELSLYFIQSSSATTFPNFYIDDCSFVKLDPAITPKPTTTAKPTTSVVRPDTAQIGVIRWDAFIPESSDVGMQVARALNVAQYRYRAPFYSIMKNDTDITFPEYTKEIWEKEADYAIDAGIDYFAYLWYSTGSGMDLARKYHMQSAKNTQIKMCAIFEKLPTGIDLKDWLDTIQSEYCVTVDGKPVVYVYTTFDRDDIKELRNLAANVGIPELYVVAMGTDFKDSAAAGANAMSQYSCGVNDGATYKSLAEKQLKWNKDTAATSGLAVVPHITVGWDPRPRILNPVSWWKDLKSNNWGQNPTAQEITDHVSDVLTWTYMNPKSTEANLVLTYAWNENDEGGWLCPTIQVDKNGVPLKDAKGSLIADTTHLDAFKKAVEAYRSIEKGTATIPPTPTATIEATPTSSVNNENTEIPSIPSGTDNGLLFLIIGAVVVIAAGVTAFVLMKKKKSSPKGTE